MIKRAGQQGCNLKFEDADERGLAFAGAIGGSIAKANAAEKITSVMRAWQVTTSS